MQVVFPFIFKVIRRSAEHTKNHLYENDVKRSIVESLIEIVRY